MISPVFVYLVCSFALEASADLALEHSFFAPLDEDQNVKLYWNVSTANQEIYFTVEAKTTGWIGFGISSGQGKMKGADIVIGWVKDGKPYFKDRHADGHMMPTVDFQQDYKMISLTEDNGKTIMKFKRKFETCDSQDNKIETGTTKLIYAYHPDDPSSENDITQHSAKHRGQRSVLLLNSRDKVPTLPSDTDTFELRQNRTVISSEKTSYVCKTFEIPKFSEKRHIVKFEPVIQAGHEGVVHHILVYECSDTFPDHHLNYTGQCYSSNMPPAIKGCVGISAFAGWAIGGKAFYYPEHAGFPIGTADSPKVVILEIHYDNPENKKGMTDSSGLRFYHTQQLRKYDAAVLEVGTIVNNYLMIPPRQTGWSTRGFCVEDCTKEGFKDSKLPDGGINIFATLMHTHLAGRKTFVRHIRDGVELPDISRDEHYDFNFQEYQVLKKEVHVAPGDSLINVCIYDTKDRQKVVTGGFATTDEMCFSYNMYYPKVALTKCNSVEAQAVWKWRAEYNYKPSVLNSSDYWTDEVNKGLKKAYADNNQVNVYCVGRGAAPLPGVFHVPKSKPVIKIPYKPESDCRTVSLGNKATAGSLMILNAILFFCRFYKLIT